MLHEGIRSAWSHIEVILFVFLCVVFSVPAVASAAPQITANANGETTLTINQGDTYYISMIAIGASWCYQQASGTGPYAGASSGFYVSPNFSDGPTGLIGSYTFSCADPPGDVGVKVVTIRVAAPVVTLSVNGASSVQIPVGGSYTLDYGSSNAASCTLSWSGSSSGSTSVTPQWSNGATAGSGSSGLVGSYTYSCNGWNGEVVSKTVTITNYPAPTCSVTADTNPLGYGNSTTLRWSSLNASSFYVNSVGYVTPNQSGSATVAPLATTVYNGSVSGSGGSSTCPYTLTVQPPASCTFNGQTVAHGSSVTAYQAATVPYGSSCVQQTRTCTNGTLSGSYTYGSCTVNPQPVSCSLSVNPASVVSGQSATLSWTSVGASSCTGSNFSTGGASSGSVSVSPSQTTTYTASCTGAGGTAQCSGNGAGGVGEILPVSCTESWTCVGAGNATVRHTRTDCSTEDIATCASPQFCSAGSAVCLYNAITGTVTASPRLVPSGGTSEISWSAADAVACTVTGNGDTWTGTSGTRTSSPITQLSTYTIVCDDADPDTTQDDFEDSVTVVRVPSWFEI